MRPIHVTEAEQVLLEALWRRGPLTPPRLIAEVQACREWGDPTIKTLLSRLMKKGAVRSERKDGRLQYRALLGRAAFVEAAVHDLVDRVFDGRRDELESWLTRRASDPYG